MPSSVCSPTHRLYIYTVKQSIDRYFNSPNSHSIVRSAKSSCDRTLHACFDIVACGVEVAGRGIVSDEPNGRIGRYLCRRNDSDVDGSRLARFNGGLFDSPSGKRTESICEEQIASCVFCCTKSFLQRKTACPQGDETLPKSALFDRRLRRERIAIFRNRRGDPPPQKFRLWRKTDRPAKAEGDAPRKIIRRFTASR